MLGLPLPAGAEGAGCGPDAAPLRRLDRDLWWVPAAAGETDATNRGRTANLVLVAEGRRLWLLGSGPSPAFGGQLACVVQQRLGRKVTDIVVPWAMPELTLGLKAWPQARTWAHADVVAAMRAQCPHCAERLRQRLGEAAADLGDDPIVIPAAAFGGDSGRLGPLRWWRLERAPGQVATVFKPVGRRWMVAHGLLWTDGPPDGRDADLAVLEGSTRALAALQRAQGPALRWLPQQGPPADASLARRTALYWQRLRTEVAQAVERGEVPGDAAAGLAEVRDLAGLRDALNRQRMWRQEEERMLGRPATPDAQERR